MSRYTALSPVRLEVEPILDDGTGPLEEVVAVVEHIEAPSAKAARLVALHHREFADVVDEARGDHRNPLGAIGVIREPEPHFCPIVVWENEELDVEPPACGQCDAFERRSFAAMQRLNAWYNRTPSPPDGPRTPDQP